MKKKFYLLIALLNCMCLTSNAQLRVLENGRVQVGTLKEDDDLLNVTTFQVFGPYGDMRAGSKLTLGDFGRYPNQGWNVFIGEYGTEDSDQLWLHGKKGIYLTTNGQASNVAAYYNPSINSNFVFNTNLRVNGVNITSDARLKENIKSLENPLSLLNNINGVTYTYRISEIQKYREPDKSKFTNILATQANGEGMGSQLSSNTAMTDKEINDKQYQNELTKKEVEDANRKRVGFLAQDIQKVLPELVQTDENGVMSIDYIGFIPIIVESIKEIQKTIDNQNEIINDLQNRLSEKESSSLLRSTNSSTGDGASLNKAKLYNGEAATVSYKLNRSFTTANLQIFDVTGKLLKNIKLEIPENTINMNSNELGYGTFIYALVVDGQKMDTLKKYINR